jgi:pre-mRNA-processing factor 6
MSRRRSGCSKRVHGIDVFVITVLIRVFTALEHIPNSVRLWKETVNLGSSHNDARNPLSRTLEHSKELEDVNKTIEVGVRELRRHQVLLTQEQWLKEAERHESEGSPRTCEVIIKATVAMEIEEEDRLDTCVGGGRDYEIRIGACIPIERAYGERLPTWRRHAVHGMFLHLRSLCLTTDETIL